MPEVVYYKDASPHRLWRYRIVADNYEIVHASHKGWPSIADTRIQLWALAQALYFLSEPLSNSEAFADDQKTIMVGGPDVSFELTRERPNPISEPGKDDWRWSVDITQAVETHLSDSHEGFKNMADCIGNAKLVGKILWDDYGEVVSDE